MRSQAPLVRSVVIVNSHPGSMKLLPTQKRANTEDNLGMGIEVAVILALFFGVGFGLDHLFGTRPVFMIIMTLLGAVGLFAKFKYSYEARMDQHEEKRTADAAARSASRAAAIAADRKVAP
jgi:ATP synthase protein I